jgi:hypothetical protein
MHVFFNTLYGCSLCTICTCSSTIYVNLLYVRCAFLYVHLSQQCIWVFCMYDVHSCMYVFFNNLYKCSVCMICIQDVCNTRQCILVQRDIHVHMHAYMCVFHSKNSFFCYNKKHRIFLAQRYSYMYICTYMHTYLYFAKHIRFFQTTKRRNNKTSKQQNVETINVETIKREITERLSVFCRSVTSPNITKDILRL